ncbi:MAG: hypothetical protein V1856_02655 [Candidatus Liptonbacteria bacterium]
MDPVMKSEIFFFVSTIAVCILTVFAAVALYYVLKILNDIKDISRKIRGEAFKITDDIEEFRGIVKEEGWPGIYQTIKKFVNGKGRNRRNKKNGQI